MVYLPPAIILISQVLLATLVGGLGLILGTPIIANIMVLIQKLYLEDTLGDRGSS
jgi:predicted PurR-regulated permease PerM